MYLRCIFLAVDLAYPLLIIPDHLLRSIDILSFKEQHQEKQVKMAHFNTLYYFFAVLAVLSVLTQAAPVQQRDESGLPTGLNGLLGGQNTPGADPTKMMSVRSLPHTHIDTQSP